MTALRTTLARCATFATSMFIATQAWAGIGNIPDPVGTGQSDIRATVIGVIQKVLSFMALIAVVLIIVAGIRLVISQGEEGEKDKAKKTIIYVIVGLVVIALAYAITVFVANALGLN